MDEHSTGRLNIGGPNGITVQNIIGQPPPGAIARAPAGPRLDIGNILANPGDTPRFVPGLIRGQGFAVGLLSFIACLTAIAVPAIPVASVAVFTFGGLAWTYASFAMAKRLEHSQLALAAVRTEQALISLAERSGGVLTVPAAAQALNCSMDDAQLALDTAAKQDHINLDVSDDGLVEYRFAALPVASNHG